MRRDGNARSRSTGVDREAIRMRVAHVSDVRVSNIDPQEGRQESWRMVGRRELYIVIFDKRIARRQRTDLNRSVKQAANLRMHCDVVDDYVRARMVEFEFIDMQRIGERAGNTIDVNPQPIEVT